MLLLLASPDGPLPHRRPSSACCGAADDAHDALLAAVVPALGVEGPESGVLMPPFPLLFHDPARFSSAIWCRIEMVTIEMALLLPPDCAGCWPPLLLLLLEDDVDGSKLSDALMMGRAEPTQPGPPWCRRP